MDLIIIPMLIMGVGYAIVYTLASVLYIFDKITGKR